MTWPERERLWLDRERHLVLDRAAAWKQLSQEHQRADRAEAEVRKLTAELSRAKKRIAELESAHRAAAADTSASPPPLPAFVKSNVAKKSRKRPGRKAGHAAALRLVQTID